MSNSNTYKINFVALKTGTHDFNYEVDRSFFEGFENSPIENAKAKVHLKLDKSENLLVLNFSIDGEIEKNCDLCLSPLLVPVSGEFRQIIKFSDEDIESNDDEVIFLPTSAYEVNVQPFIYEFMVLLDPVKATHEAGECDLSTKNVLDEYLLREEVNNIEGDDNSEEKDDEVDPRWSELLKLKNKK